MLAKNDGVCDDGEEILRLTNCRTISVPTCRGRKSLGGSNRLGLLIETKHNINGARKEETRDESRAAA